MIYYYGLAILEEKCYLYNFIYICVCVVGVGGKGQKIGFYSWQCVAKAWISRCGTV